MRELIVNLGERSYPICIGSELLSSGKIFSDLIKSSQIMIVTNTTVAALYLERLTGSLGKFNPVSVVIPDGEAYKTLETMNNIITNLLDNRFSRDCCLIALGGGVVGDITGFAAACYQRGVSFIQIPTTLLAQVDASVGGKTGVNHPLGKNMIGAFHQPAGVVIDISVLDTLSDREMSAGLAEIIKYGLIRDEEFFAWLEKNIGALLERDRNCLIHAVERSCRNKAEVVSMDEREGGIRAILNLGHTFGHAIETKLNYKKWLHGEAVATGMLMAAELSCRMNWLDKETVQRIKLLLEKANLPVKLPASLNGDGLMDTMVIDKKSRQGRMRLVLLKGIGEACVTADYDHDALQKVLDTFPRESDSH